MSRVDILKYGVISAGTVVGFTAGYLTAKKRLAGKYAAQLENEMELTRDHYRRKHKEPPYDTAESAAAVLGSEGGELVEAEDLDIEVLPKQFQEFARRQKELGNDPEAAVRELLVKTEEYAPRRESLQEEEIVSRLVARSHREPDKPYLIDTDEWHENENDLNQLVLTWWAGDRVLMDERDQPVPEVNDMVGLQNLEAFGRTGGSETHVIYIRNERLGAIFEVILEEGRYAVEIMGDKLLDEAESNSKIRNSRRGRDD